MIKRELEGYRGIIIVLLTHEASEIEVDNRDDGSFYDRLNRFSAILDR